MSLLKTILQKANIINGVTEIYPIWYEGNALRWNKIDGITSYRILTSNYYNSIPEDPPWRLLCEVPVNFYYIPLSEIDEFVCGIVNPGGSWGRPSKIPH
jgi:hypothetical protein